MGLVNLTTNLKSLRYGKDTVGGGNSAQPFVTTPIPDDLSDVGRTGGPDFLLRGGTLLPKIVFNDAKRISKLFYPGKGDRINTTDPDNPLGIDASKNGRRPVNLIGTLFTAKQNILSLTNVSSQVGYVVAKDEFTPPIGNTGTAIGNLLRSLVPPLNQGIYLPLSTIGQTAGNAIGLHLDKQGLGFNFKTTVGSPDGNSLLGLPTYLNTISTGGDNGNKSRLFGLLDKINNNTGADNILYSYSGGPGATLGVGKTNIRMVGDLRTGVNNPLTRKIIESNISGPKYRIGSAFRQVPNFEAIVFNARNPDNLFPLSETRIQGGQAITYTSPNRNFSPTVNDENLSDKINNDKVYRIGASAAFFSNGYNGSSTFLNHFNSSGTSVHNSIYNNSLNPYNLETKLDNVGFKSGVGKDGGTVPRQVWTQGDIESATPFSTTGNQNDIVDFTKKVAPKGSQYIPNSLNYVNGNKIENRVNLGDPGKRANRISYTIGRQEKGQDLTVSQNSDYKHALDKVNALPIYQSSSPTTDSIKNDLVKFRIGVISNSNPNLKTYIHFRAFIDSMSDNFTAEWQDQAYMGRGEKFYKYQGFDRSINLSWTVAAQSKQELIPMHQKLNYLASVCAPDYSPEGYMGGNLISLTIGGWCYEQVGIMKGLNLEIPTESPWEIALPDEGNKAFAQDGSTILSDASVKELPMIIKVTGFNFIPIHNFVPRIQQNYFPDKNGALLKGGGTFVGEYGKEQYIGLATTGGKNNYSGGKGNINYVPSRVNQLPTTNLKKEGIDFNSFSSFETPNSLI